MSDDVSDDFVLEYEYGFSVIYNVKSTDSKRNAIKITERLEKEGLVGYIADRDASKDVTRLEELASSIRKSKFIIALFDKDFKKDNFNVHAQETAFKEVLEAGQLARFIPITMGIPRKNNVPGYIPNFCLELPMDWDASDKQFARLKKTLNADITSSMSYFGLDITPAKHTIRTA